MTCHRHGELLSVKTCHPGPEKRREYLVWVCGIHLYASTIFSRNCAHHRLETYRDVWQAEEQHTQGAVNKMYALRYSDLSEFFTLEEKA